MIEWKETNGDFTAVCSYDTLTESYTVEVTHTDGRQDSATWVRMGYEPRFGMDDQDAQRSIRESESICVRMESEEWRDPWWLKEPTSPPVQQIKLHGCELCGNLTCRGTCFK